MPKLDLLPCPFCGGKAETFPLDKYDSYGNHERLWYSECGECFARSGYYNTEGEAAIAWNTRSSGWIPCGERMPEPGDIVLVYAHVSVSDEEYWDEQFTAISVPKKMFHAFKGEEGTCWIGASNLHRLGDMISAETGFHFRGSEYVDTMRITHWMPLPKQPQRKDDTHDYD